MGVRGGQSCVLSWQRLMIACSPILLPTGPLSIPSTQGSLFNFPDSSAAVGEASLADGEGRYLAQAVEEARLGRLSSSSRNSPPGLREPRGVPNSEPDPSPASAGSGEGASPPPLHSAPRPPAHPAGLPSPAHHGPRRAPAGSSRGPRARPFLSARRAPAPAASGAPRAPVPRGRRAPALPARPAGLAVRPNFPGRGPSPQRGDPGPAQRRAAPRPPPAAGTSCARDALGARASAAAWLCAGRARREPWGRRPQPGPAGPAPPLTSARAAAAGKTWRWPPLALPASPPGARARGPGRQCQAPSAAGKPNPPSLTLTRPPSPAARPRAAAPRPALYRRCSETLRRRPRARLGEPASGRSPRTAAARRPPAPRRRCGSRPSRLHTVSASLNPNPCPGESQGRLGSSRLAVPSPS